MRTQNSTHQGRAYTLMEMMIVMVILIVVMALVAPVIGNARNAAKQTNTRQLLNNLSQASQQFELDNRRLAGYFEESQMGSVENLQRGFGSVANVLLDLTNGIIDQGGQAPDDAITVGPTTASTVMVKVSLIGAPTQTKGVITRGYFNPDPKYYELQPDTEHEATSVAHHLQLPDLVDAFGQPILAWRQDLEPNASTEFSRPDASERGSFYWNSNAAFLNATKLGRRGQDQTSVATTENGSMLATGVGEPKILASMHGLLGNPAFPRTGTAQNDPQIPAAARGRLIFHSAGIDGSFLGRKDRGGILATSPNGPGHVKDVVDYRGGRDPLSDFDDVIGVAGN